MYLHPFKWGDLIRKSGRLLDRIAFFCNVIPVYVPDPIKLYRGVWCSSLMSSSLENFRRQRVILQNRESHLNFARCYEEACSSPPVFLMVLRNFSSPLFLARSLRVLFCPRILVEVTRNLMLPDCSTINYTNSLIGLSGKI